MRRTAGLIAFVAGVVIVSKLLVENVAGVRLDSLVEARMSDAGAGTATIILGLLAVDILVPVPSSLVMILSGAAFGVVYGSIISLVGSIGGEWLGFELVRRWGRRAAGRLVGDIESERLGRLIDRHGAAVVMVTRALPVVMETMSVVAGLSTMRRRTFLLASLAGTAPIVVIYAWAGAASRQAGSLVPAVVIAIAIVGLGWILYRARFRDLTPPPASSSAASRG
jgi:3-dehydroquinate synthase